MAVHEVKYVALRCSCGDEFWGSDLADAQDQFVRHVHFSDPKIREQRIIDAYLEAHPEATR